MQKNDWKFLSLVALCALLFAGITLMHTSNALSSWNAPAVSPGSSGQPRVVDMERLEELIRGGHLSGHEALHYQQMEPTSP